LNFKTLRYDS